MNTISVRCPFQHDDPLAFARKYHSISDLQEHLLSNHSLTLQRPHELTVIMQEYLDKISDTNNHQESDHALRHQLHTDKLNQIIRIQQSERQQQQQQQQQPAMDRHCLFCRSVHATRQQLFTHMSTVHGFRIGHLDNLVFVDELLSKLGAKLDEHTCICCDGVFTSGAVLRVHMRKKKHFTIDPRNQEYDKYYLINYLEPGVNWRTLKSSYQASNTSSQGQQDEEDNESNAAGWSDWESEGDVVRLNTSCLFCDHMSTDPQLLLNEHLVHAHSFDIRRVASHFDLDGFYDLVKLINYIRRRTSLAECWACAETFTEQQHLYQHIENKHADPMQVQVDELEWHNTMYLFPTYEDDPLLQALDFEDADMDAETQSDVDLSMRILRDLDIER